MLTKVAVFSGAILVAVSLVPSSSWAQEKPIQISLIGPTIQLVDDDADIKGLRLNLLYGVNRNVTGLDLGLINRTDQDFKGVQFGFVGLTDGNAKGWHDNVINVTRGEFVGLQTGFVNIAGSGEGFQWGAAFNRADDFAGLQLSLVNFAEDLHGVQIGLINIIRSKERFSFLPIVNWKFD
jgi:hypothetical protein